MPRLGKTVGDTAVAGNSVWALLPAATADFGSGLSDIRIGREAPLNCVDHITLPWFGAVVRTAVPLWHT